MGSKLKDRWDDSKEILPKRINQVKKLKGKCKSAWLLRSEMIAHHWVDFKRSICGTGGKQVAKFTIFM